MTFNIANFHNFEVFKEIGCPRVNKEIMDVSFVCQ